MQRSQLERSAIAILFATVSILSGPLHAAETIEEYTVEATRLEKPARVAIEKWTTAAERSALLEVLAKNDSKLNLDTLERQETKGYVQLTETQRFDLHYAVNFKSGEGRRLLLVTNRPIRLEGDVQASGGEPAGMTIIDQTGMTIIDLTIGADGVGTGVVVVGADASIDEATGGVRILTPGGPPQQLGEVKRVDRE